MRCVYAAEVVNVTQVRRCVIDSNGAGVRVVGVNNKFGNSNSSAVDVFCSINVFLSSRRIERYIYIVGVESA